MLAIQLNAVNNTRESCNGAVDFRRLAVSILGSNDKHFYS